ncbi:phenylacetate-CoA oxygenase/reductase subunit PaaK [Segetibacter sp. 3557_3]|uniref:1,2-phenylacetyl-CoA epoxidase subunit PaaE n=1 Tax=Segetibacter sp. 3557_3 TaxID=2547429 RepID=UPI00105844AF|nr:1,2-phenylacetyl-CoA epoxidase subunit PaaE [Segetibacter sp. 3557_3]TDH23059.1 phenylacetate-CoA oxygenase/reductase subunit PaaK [Segetibacter sp. 3557_3]
MGHFHPLTIKEVRRETADCISLLFDVPENLKDEFSYHHGQSLTLRLNINGQEVRRSYSICSSPLDNELRIAIKKVDQGVFSSYANQSFKAGDILEVMRPSGKFHATLDRENKNSYIAFAAGSGITPIFSIIKTTLVTEPNSKFTLVYGNRNRSSIIFREQLEALKNKFVSRFRIIHILSREKMDAPINVGRINKEKCAALFEKLLDLNQTAGFFLCGPAEMIFEVKEYLLEHGVDPNKIHFELFGTPVKQQNSPVEKSTTERKSAITIKLDGTSFDFQLAFDSESILDAALRQGADLPYACKGGVCCTCRAKLVEGKVDMTLNYALEPDELEQGFILTCQSHPRTEKVVIDYDVK